MHTELTNLFYRLYKQDYKLITQCLESLEEDQIWTSTPEGVSIANLICHVCEMETFWIDSGLCGNSFDRDRQIEFDRKNNLDKEALTHRIKQRNIKTNEEINKLSKDQWDKIRNFHGDDFTGEGILFWHIHHLGLHRGHIQAHTRWLKLK